MPTAGIPGWVAGTWDIDPVHSHIGFAGRHMVVSKVRGHLEKFEGQKVTAEDPMRSSAALTVEMNSVIPGTRPAMMTCARITSSRPPRTR
jgi:polyisoprenoid-binding protein YceI